MKTSKGSLLPDDFLIKKQYLALCLLKIQTIPRNMYIASNIVRKTMACVLAICFRNKHRNSQFLTLCPRIPVPDTYSHCSHFVAPDSLSFALHTCYARGILRTLACQHFQMCLFYILLLVSQNPASFSNCCNIQSLPVLSKKRHPALTDISKSPTSQFIFYQVLIFTSLGWKNQLQKVIV